MASFFCSRPLFFLSFGGGGGPRGERRKYCWFFIQKCPQVKYFSLYFICRYVYIAHLPVFTNPSRIPSHSLQSIFIYLPYIITHTVYNITMKQIFEAEEKPFTSSVNICSEAWARICNREGGALLHTALRYWHIQPVAEFMDPLWES